MEINSNALSMLDVDDLKMMRCLSRGLTVRATSKALNVTQPAISQRLRKVERVFGVFVINRNLPNRAGAKLTDHGESIAAACHEALFHLEREYETMHMEVLKRHGL